MPNPFPGVDPFIEDQHYWPDFHQSFMTYWRDLLIEGLPESYEARLEERVRFVELSEQEGELRMPDLTVERRRRARRPASAASATLTLEPVTLSLPVVEEARESRIQILHRPGRTLVAMLELLSPSNKTGSGRDAYLAKRIEIITHRPRIHLVEVDLLLGGQRLPMGDPLPAGDYFAFVSRGERRPTSEVYAWSIRQPLPTIPIPLRDPDPDLLVDLTALLATAYQRGRYDRSINYKAPLRLPLTAKVRRWAQQQARSRRS